MIDLIHDFGRLLVSGFTACLACLGIFLGMAAHAPVIDRPDWDDKFFGES